MLASLSHRITNFKLNVSHFFSSDKFHEFFLLFSSFSYALRGIVVALLLLLFVRQVIKTRRSPLLRAHAQRNIMIQNDIGNVILIEEWDKKELDYLTKVQYRGSYWSVKIDKQDKSDIDALPKAGLYKIVGMEGNALLVVYNDNQSID